MFIDILYLVEIAYFVFSFDVGQRLFLGIISTRSTACGKLTAAYTQQGHSPTSSATGASDQYQTHKT